MAIEKEGCLPRKVEDIECTEDINLGNYELYKKVS